MALARFQRTITTDAGIIVPGALVEVRRESNNGLPALFSDRDGVVPISNPFLADLQGFAAFHVIGGIYRITVTAGAFSKTWRFVGIGTTAEFDVEQLALDYPNFPDLAEAQVVGRPFGAGTGDPGPLTAIQIRGILNTVGGSLFGPDRQLVLSAPSTNLTANDSGKLIQNFNATRTVLLPPPGSAPGACYGFWSGGTGSLTVDSVGNFLNFPDGTFSSSLVLSGAQSFILANDGGAWYAFGTSIKGRPATTTDTGVVRFATAAEYRANVAGRGLNVDETWASAAVVGLADATTIGVDFGAGYNFSVTLAGNRTLGNPTAVKTGQAGVIVINQDGTGGRTLAYGNNWEFVGGVPPTLSTPANTKDVLFYFAQSPTSIIGTGLAKAVV